MEKFDVLNCEHGSRLQGYLWEEIRQRILERDHFRCVSCGSQDRCEVDHVVAIALGGTDEDDNLQTLCYVHHKIKSKTDAYKIAKKKRYMRIMNKRLNI